MSPRANQIEQDGAALALGVDVGLERQVTDPILPQRHVARSAANFARVVGVEIRDQPRPRLRHVLAILDVEPVGIEGNEVLVADPGLCPCPVGRFGDRVRAPAVGRFPVLAAGVAARRLAVPGPGLPAQGPARVRHLVDDEVVIVHRLRHRPDLVRRFAGDVESVRVGLAARRRRGFGPDVDVAVTNANGFVRPADQPLDVVHPGIARIAEYHHVPALGIGKVVGKLGDQDAVAVVGVPAPPLLGRPIDVHREAAIRAGSGHDVSFAHGVQRILSLALRRLGIIQHGAGRLDSVVLFAAGADPVAVAAFGTDQVFMPALQRGRHRTGGDHERFGLERAKQERQDERNRHGFDRFAHRAMGGLRRAGAGLPAARGAPAGFGLSGFLVLLAMFRGS